MMILATHPNVLHVSERMRASDAREIYATSWADDPADLAARVMMAPGFTWTAHGDDGEPIAVIGSAPLWPNMWQAYAFATDRWPEVYREVTKHALRYMIPGLENSGVHRAQCASIEGHDDAHRWLEFLGASRTSTLDGYGKGGERFFIYSWSR